MKKNNRKKINKSEKQSIISWTYGQSYKGEVRSTITLPGTPVLLTTAVTTGLIAASYEITPNNVTNFSTRFGSTFESYRIVGCRMRIRPLVQSTGVSAVFWDENTTAVPTLTEAQGRVGDMIQNSIAAGPSQHTSTWSVKKIEDLSFVDVGTPYTFATFKLYTNAANFGGPATALNLFLLTPELDFQFKGLQSA